MRDDFTQKTKEKLAHRVGYRCSKPGCGIPTRGAASDDDGTINLGEAAHITAASPHGPRYDPSIESSDRKHLKNGIWLCGTHAKLVDSDESYFTVEELISWKKSAERKSFADIVSSNKNSAETLFTIKECVQASKDLLLECSIHDLLAFKSTSEWPSHVIDLNLKISGDRRAKKFTASGFASAINVFNEIAVVAPPGTGKTTTLLQITDAIITDRSSVAVFIPLSEWSTTSDEVFQFIIRRAAFKNAESRQFEILAESGNLVLVLDGWNELDVKSKRQIRNYIKSLQRDYPDIRLVISTRHKDLDIPIDGRIVEIDAMTEEQQFDLAKATMGLQGEILMDHALRTPGLRELVSIPLYLVALLKQAPEGALPTTKEKVLRLFVQELEKDPDKMSILREVLQDSHFRYLEAIAVEATSLETVVLPNNQARATVNIIQQDLMATDQIAMVIQPMKVLNALVSYHMLIMSGVESGGIAFQHQQFQEWYASYWVGKLMLRADSGDSDAKTSLRENVLNVRLWEEAILFACDRLSRDDQSSVKAVANAIIETLGIDPLLAADMIFRSSDEVWETAGNNVMTFAEKWHTKGQVDRGFKFMIDTGRPEFSEYIWPLISNPDDQIHLHALRSGRIFRPSVLGPDKLQRISALPEAVRVNVIGEISSMGGIEGIEIATQIAKKDKSSLVKVAAIESLQFRRADRFVTEVLHTAHDNVWKSLAKKQYAYEISDSACSERLKREQEKIFEVQSNSQQQLHSLLYISERSSVIGNKLRALIEKIDFSREVIDYSPYIHRSYEIYPKETLAALITQIEMGKEVPYSAKEIIQDSVSATDEGALPKLVLKPELKERVAPLAVSLVGPKTVNVLINQYIDIYSKLRNPDGSFNREVSDEYYRLSGLISLSKLASFSTAILTYGNTVKPQEILALSELIDQHKKGFTKSRALLDSDTHEKMTSMVLNWANILISSPESTRSHFGEIARAIEKLGSTQFVPILEKLLAEDLLRKKRAQKEYLEALKTGQTGNTDAHVCWALQYQKSFAAIGDEQTIKVMQKYLSDMDFGFEASMVLKSIWEKGNPSNENFDQFHTSPDFSFVFEKRKERRSCEKVYTHQFVNYILIVITDFITNKSDASRKKQALKLSSVAFSMPFSGLESIINRLCDLPVYGCEKNNFLTALVQSGEIISAETLHKGVEYLLQEAKEKAWMMEESNGWRLEQWLRLYPFSDNPDTIFDALDLLESRYKGPRELGGLISALGSAPSIEAENVLIKLGIGDSRFLESYAWIDALTSHKTYSAACAFLDLICQGRILPTGGSFDSRHLFQNLSNLMNLNDKFRMEVYDQYPNVSNSQAKLIIERAIAESSDINGVLLLIHSFSAQNKTYEETPLYSAIRNILVGTRKSIEWPGMEENYSLPAMELRKKLFSLVIISNKNESLLATRCLNTIDEIHDDYGQVEFEGRHPDIKRKVAWPIIDIST